MADTKISALAATTDPQTADEFAINDGGTSKKITFENLTKRHQVVPCVMEVPQGTVAFPDILSMTTSENKKITGIVLPDGANPGILNFKCIIPEDLHTTSAQAIRIRFISLATGTEDAVHLTLKTVGIAVNENADIDFTDETPVVAECSDTINTMNEALVNIDLGTDWVSGDTVMGLLVRTPADGDDDYAGDILIVGIELLLFTVGSA